MSGGMIMSKNKAAKEANERFKMEVANELGLNLSKEGANLSAKEAGRIGGRMVKKMIEEYKKNMK